MCFCGSLYENVAWIATKYWYNVYLPAVFFFFFSGHYCRITFFRRDKDRLAFSLFLKLYVPREVHGLCIQRCFWREEGFFYIELFVDDHFETSITFISPPSLFYFKVDNLNIRSMQDEEGCFKFWLIRIFHAPTIDLKTEEFLLNNTSCYGCCFCPEVFELLPSDYSYFEGEMNNIRHRSYLVSLVCQSYFILILFWTIFSGNSLKNTIVRNLSKPDSLSVLGLHVPFSCCKLADTYILYLKKYILNGTVRLES